MVVDPEKLAKLQKSAPKKVGGSRVKAKKAIKKAFQYQMEGHGLNIVEVLSTCPTNWGLSPVEAMKWLEDNMIPYYPLGVYKDKGAE